MRGTFIFTVTFDLYASGRRIYHFSNKDLSRHLNLHRATVDDIGHHLDCHELPPRVLGVLRAARQVLVAVVTATVEDEGEERQQTTSVGALDLVVTSDFAPSAVKFSDTLRTSSTIQRKFKHNFVLVSREQVLRALYTNPSSVAAGLRAWFANGEKASCEQ
ncbi:unnamed protein product [Fusarium graminearum]|uniref:Uncharacterized protein n=1 Tax=Gibberella zeae TaxID=5518 RepID=A0A4E9DKY7_GIBZA|nr:unnamed protein product [Fusarium graminearum]